MSANVNSKPIGLMAPWWSDLQKATADQRVTKTEVKKLIETHKDMFSDKSYHAALDTLLADGSKVRLTDGARTELHAALHPAHIWMPTKDQMTKTYGNICESAMREGTAKQLDHAPAGYKSAPSFNITPKGMADNNRVVYDVKGHLYLATTCFTGITNWFDCGPAPMF